MYIFKTRFVTDAIPIFQSTYDTSYSCLRITEGLATALLLFFKFWFPFPHLSLGPLRSRHAGRASTCNAV